MSVSVPCIVLIFLCVGSTPSFVASLDALNNLDAPAPDSRRSPSQVQVIPPRERPIEMQMSTPVADEVPDMVNAGNPAAFGLDPVENGNADSLPVPMPGADENEDDSDNETDASVKRDKRLFFWKNYDYYYDYPRYYHHYNYYKRPRYYYRPRPRYYHRPYFYYHWKW